MKTKRVLLISPVPSHPQTAGNRIRIYNLARAIKQLGHDLYFAHIEREIGDTDAMKKCWGNSYHFTIPYSKPNKLSLRIRKKLKSFIDKDSKYTFHIDAWYDDSANDCLKKLHKKYQFDIVFVEYAFFSKALTCFPDHVIKVIDTHDVFTNRHKIYLKNNYNYNWFSTTSGQERKGLRRADIIIAIQDKEKEALSRLSRKKTVVVGHTVKTKIIQRDPPLRGNILFIGSSNQGNIDAIDFFCNEVFPIIKHSVPYATLLVAGPVCRVLNSVTEDIVKLGVVANLETIYDKTDIVINPVRLGTGLKIKNIEALGYSKPLVTTSIGAEGMETGMGKAFLVADDAKSFADAVTKIFSTRNHFQSLSKHGYEFATSWNEEQFRSLQQITNTLTSS